MGLPVQDWIFLPSTLKTELGAWRDSDILLAAHLRAFGYFCPMDISKIPSPCFVLDEALLRRNLQILNRVQQEAGISIIVAFKGFAMWSAFPLVRQYLPGATASSLNEARLCYEEMGVKAHTYAVAYPVNLAKS
jgi:diaminopimelate decarboxylase